MADTRETKNQDRTRSYAGGRSLSSSNYPRAGRPGSLPSREANTPISMMRRMLEDMDRMVYGFTGGALPELWSGGDLERSLWSPQIETFRRDNQLVVRADLPGMNKENVNVEIEDDTLLISGERQDEHEEERDDFYRSERSYGRFFRAIPLPDGVDPNSAKAEFKDGVLEIAVPVPKEPERSSRRIDIK